MFNELHTLIERPEPFSINTRAQLWTTPYIANNMLEVHLNPHVNAASRKKTFLTRSTQFITERFGLDQNTSVIDFGCGPGLYTQEFAKTGADVTGLDFSATSLAYGKNKAIQENLKINYIQTDYLKFKATRKYDLATLIYCDYGAIAYDDRKKLLEVMKDSLKENGRLILDVDSMARFQTKEEAGYFGYSAEPSFLSEEASFQFNKTYRYEDVLVFLEHITIVTKLKTEHIYNWMQCFTKESLEEELRNNGFMIESCYSNIAGDPYTDTSEEIAVVCRKI